MKHPSCAEVVKVDAPKPRGASAWNELPDPHRVAELLQLAHRIDASLRATTTVPITEIRDLAGLALSLATSLGTVRNAANDLTRTETQRLAGIIQLVDYLLGRKADEASPS